MRPQRIIGDEAKESLQQLLQTSRTKRDFLRVQCVWLRAELGFDAITVGKITGYSPGTVKKIWGIFFRDGRKALQCKKRGGRQRCYLTHQDERKFLSQFLDNPPPGTTVQVSDIKQAYENIIQKKVPKSTIYRMLARHGWHRKP